MSNHLLPRHSRKNTDHAMRPLAVAKMLKDRMKPAEVQAKAYLMEKEMSPKDRRTVTGPDGSDIGTISMAQPAKRRGTGLKVADPVALAQWAENRGITHGGKPSIELPEWFTAEKHLEALINQAGGEMPDGVVDTTEPGEPYLIVRQTAAQADGILGGFTSAHGLIEAVSPELVEGEEGNE